MKRLGIVLLLLLFCVACKDYKKEAVKNMVTEHVGTKVNFPDSLLYRSLSDSIVSLPQKPIKVVTHINGECISCLNQFIDWMEIGDSLTEAGNVDLVFYIRSIDFESVQGFLSEVNFKYPFFIDPNSDILFNNNIPLNKSTLHTFLLDKDNKIVLIGSPLGNPKLADLYKHQIQQLSQKQAKK